jgi:hypothetical protein
MKRGINFLIKNLKVFSFLVILGYIYFAIHEFLHYYFITSFGYSAKICWLCFPARVTYLTPLDQVLKNYYFISAVAPYLFSIILLGILFFLFVLTKKKILAVLAIIPFLDTLFNILAIPIASFTKTGNDFLNLFKLGFYHETIIIMIIPIAIFLIINKLRMERGLGIFK